MPHSKPVTSPGPSILRLVTFTTLYPNEVMQHHGIFVEQRLRNLLESGEVSSRVVAPVPWFPFANANFGQYGEYSKVPGKEVRHGIEIVHPRYPVIPKVGMSVAPILLAGAISRLIRRYAADRTGFDLIDAHYFYPDGIAAMLVAARLKMPVVITARGTDVNLIPEYRIPRRWILWAAKRCSKIITVSEALREQLLSIGAAPESVQTLRNGVDLKFFRPLPDRDRVRRKLGFNGVTLLSVGHLIDRKGHHLVIEALADLPDMRLIIVGDGPMMESLEKLAEKFRVSDRVHFQGPLSQDRLVEFYNAADALVLASSREGMANVLLECIACGTPVVASPVWGNPEVVSDVRAGTLMKDRSVGSVVEAARVLLENRPARDATREYAMRFGWQDTTRGQIDIFRAAVNS